MTVDGSDVGESERLEEGRRTPAAKRCREPRSRLGVRTAVVVEHDDDASTSGAQVVEGLERETAGKSSVTDDGDDVIRTPTQVAGGGQPVRVGQRGGRVAVLHQIVRRFGAIRITGESV